LPVQPEFEPMQLSLDDDELNSTVFDQAESLASVERIRAFVADKFASIFS
jgi:hypothetical protein